MIDNIIVSKVRIKLLEVFLNNPDELYHVRGLVRKINEEINAVRRELANLMEAGFLKKEPRGNRLYYWINKDYLFYNEFAAVFSKITGLGGQIIKNKNRIGKIAYCLFSTEFIHREQRKEDQVDVFVVGEIVLAELAGLIKEEEEKRGREINYTCMSEDEFIFRKKRNDPFLAGILARPKVMLIGKEKDLLQQ